MVRTKQLTAMEKQRGTEGFVELKREFGGVQGPKIPLSLHDTLRTLAGKIHGKGPWLWSRRCRMVSGDECM